jgi:hypothetical protein
MMELRSLDFDTADSKEEVHFSWWLNELHEAGYISDWQYQPRTFDLSETITYGVEVQLKTKVRIDEKCLMQKHTYTPDFRISWNVDAKHLFYSNVDCGVDLKKCLIVAQGGISHIDIKPKAWGNNSFMEAFKLNQKWVYAKYGVFVQPVVTWGGATSCFESTFCPARFIYTDKTRKIRELKFTARSLDMFLKMTRG